MNYKIGICQFYPKLLKKAENLNKMQKMVDGKDADLIVFPELATSGYAFQNKDEVMSIADDFEKSQTTEMFRELSNKNNCSYVMGFPEKIGDKLYNSSMLINPDGTKHLYRKIHLFNEEKIWFEPGNLGFNAVKAVFDIMVGQMICFDWIFPESARTLMLKGAQIIAHPANLVLPWCQQAMITRSLENRVFSITCNRIGTESVGNAFIRSASGSIISFLVPKAERINAFPTDGGKGFVFTGKSQVVSPQGELLFQLKESEEKVQIIEIETDLANNKNITPYNNIIDDRQIKYYR